MACVEGAGHAADLSWLFGVGVPSPRASMLEVNPLIPKAGVKPDEPIIFRVKATRDVYATVIGISALGEALILLPNKENQSGMLSRGDHVLFGEKSKIQVRVSGQQPVVRYAFYSSSRPFSMEGLWTDASRNLVRVPADDRGKLELVRQNLVLMAQAQGFDRKIVSLRADKPDGVLNLMGGYGEPSETPDTLTGVAGRSNGRPAPNSR
jgi:hypothetical protein